MIMFYEMLSSYAGKETKKCLTVYSCFEEVLFLFSDGSAEFIHKCSVGIR